MFIWLVIRQKTHPRIRENESGNKLYFGLKTFAFKHGLIFTQFSTSTNAKNWGYQALYSDSFDLNSWKDLQTPGLEDLKQAIMDHTNGERFEDTIAPTTPDTEAQRFHGQVYVLIDRFSYSNAVSVAAVVKDYSFGTVVGEATTDTPSAFGAAQSFKLPKTGLSVMFPKAFITRPSGDRRMQGVQPDHWVLDDFSTPEDEVVTYVLNLIQAQKHG